MIGKNEYTEAEMTPSTEMPKYKSHKTVWALKIASIAYDHEAANRESRETDGSAMITPAEEGYAPFKVDSAYCYKHLNGLSRPAIIGGYYVVYSDGYKSFSPAKAFEEGYTRA